MLKMVNEFNSLGIITSFQCSNFIFINKTQQFVHVCFPTLNSLPYKGGMMKDQVLQSSTQVVTVDAVDEKVNCGCCSEIIDIHLYIYIYIYIYIYNIEF